MLRKRMKLKNRINQRLGESSTWILNSPESLVILMLMATSMATIFFALLATVMGINANWFLMGLFALFSLLSLKPFIKMFKIVRKAGLKDALSGITANEFVWHKNKYGGVLDGGNGFESNESRNEQDADGNGKIGKEVRDIYK